MIFALGNTGVEGMQFAAVVLLVDRSALPVWLLDDLYTAITRATTHLTVIYCTFSFIAFIV